MMTTKIDYQGIHLEGQLIAPDTPEWHEWLSTAKSFRFELDHETWIDGRVPMVKTLTFSGVKVGSYWQAHKKSGSLRREYLGKSPSLAKLKEVDVLINSDSYWHQKQRSAKSVSRESHKNSYETVSEHSSQAGDEIAKLKAELERITQDRDNLLIKLALEDAQQPSALELLNQFLDEHPKIAEHLTDTRRYRAGEDLAKFGAWLRADRVH